MDKPIVVFGPIAYDDIETRYGRVKKILGGCGAYTSVVVSSYAVECSLISIVGKDFKQTDREFLINKGVSLEHLETEPTDNTLFWSGYYSEDFTNRITRETKVGVYTNYDPIIPEGLKNPEILVLGNISPQIQWSIWNQFSKKPVLTVLDTMNYWIDSQLEFLKRIIGKVDVISINNEEAFSLTNERNPHDAAKKLMAMGPRYVIIKLGEFGAYLFSKHQYYYSPAHTVDKAIDPTGAGDCFIGGFIGYLYQSKDYSFENMKMAMGHGTVSASFVVEDFGLKNLEYLNQKSRNLRFKQYKTSIESKLEPSPQVYERLHQA
ncbi:MAG: PfkB family carbohydrate kinase [Flavobacteriaceae bacterium]|nr:PfkB family carbohydrate kinase [Flavobacteriaceae bacterium]MCY4217167.1 PfkB family carbohydrate kinase [Flavobacteriaceae bacterium]